MLITLLGSLFPSSTGELRAFLATHYPEINKQVSERAPIAHAVAAAATRLIEREQVDAALWDRLKRGRSRDAEIDAAARRFDELYEEGEIGVPPPWLQWLSAHGRLIALVAVAVAVATMAVILAIDPDPDPVPEPKPESSGGPPLAAEEVEVLAGRVEGLGVCTARLHVRGHGESEVTGHRFKVELPGLRDDEDILHASLYIHGEPVIERDVPRDEWGHVLIRIHPGCKGPFGLSGRVTRLHPGSSSRAADPIDNARVTLTGFPREVTSDDGGRFKLWGLSESVTRPDLEFRVYPPDEDGGLRVSHTVAADAWDDDPSSGPFVELELPALDDAIPRRGEPILALHVLAPPVDSTSLERAFFSKNGRLKSGDPSIPVPAKLGAIEGALASTAMVRAGTGSYATALLIAPRTVLTSGHVAKSIGPGATVTFADNVGSATPVASRTVAVVGKPKLHPLWDLALLELGSDPPKDVVPAPLAAEPPEALAGRAVALVGYPHPGSLRDTSSYVKVYGKTKAARRTTLGKTIALANVKDGDEAQRVIVHDAFSAEGIPGGPLVDVNTGLVIGVHFGRRDGHGGFVVPSWALFRDPLVRSAAVNFRDMDGTRAGGPVVRKVVHDPDYSSRTGYDPKFTGVEIPLPKAKETVLARTDEGGSILDYEHFSVAMHAKRKLPVFVAANVDGRKKLRRPEPGKNYSPGALAGVDTDRANVWLLDPRIEAKWQLSPGFLARYGNELDREHLAGRGLVVWGETYKELRRANGDTYHLTNVLPGKTGASSRAGAWAEIEKRIVALASDRRVTVMLGPIFDQDDATLDGVQIPGKLWVVVADVEGGKLRTGAMVLSQSMRSSRVPMVTHRVLPAVTLAPVDLAKLEAAIGLLKFPKVLHESQTNVHPVTKGIAPR